LFLILLLLGGFFGFGENFCWAEENDLIITEIMYDPEGSNSEHSKWLEIYNNGEDYDFSVTKSVDSYKINNFYICDSYSKITGNCVKHYLYTDIPVLSFKKGEYFIIATNPDQFKNDYATTETMIKSALGISSSNKSFVKLCFINDTNCDEMVGYGNFGIDVNEGYSLERINFNSENSKENWQKSYQKNGTPGEKSSIKKVFGKEIIFNELFPHPKKESDEVEFIELFNPTEKDIKLDDWLIVDHGGYECDLNGKMIKSEGYLILKKNMEEGCSIALNDMGEEIVELRDPNDDVAATAAYSSSKEGLSYSFNGNDWKWTKFLTPGEKNEFEKKLKVAIVKIKANPKGKDTVGEEIYLKNNSKKKINLKTWSIATGSKTLYNHPITKDFIIQPGKTKKITRKYSLFTLNNKKGAIELRYPNGEVASRVKYDKKKESVKDDEVYELAGKNWQWTAPAEETSIAKDVLQNNSSPSEENPEDIDQEIELNVSEEEIALNLGKFSSLENKLALAEINFIPAGEIPCQSRENLGIVLGAFSARDKIHQPVEIRPVNSWQKTLQKSNQFFNLLINRVVSLI
jgi:hypothetical protein